MQVKELYCALTAACDEIDLAWSAHGYSQQHFPDAVQNSTVGLDLTPLGSLTCLSELLSIQRVAQLQRPSSFSDLYIKLFDNGRFWVEILHWHGSDINIHDHDFSAVQFQLRGRSLNVTYAFDDVISEGNLNIGNLSVSNAEIWGPGSRSVVAAGRFGLHNVCHLDGPTVSLLIRTHPNKNYGPQWNYFAPGVAASYGIVDIVFRKRLQSLRLLSKGDRSAFHSAFIEHIRSCTFGHSLFTFIKMIDILFEDFHSGMCIDLCEEGSGIFAEVVNAAARYRAVEIIKATRHSIVPPSEDNLPLAILSASFDAKSATKIADDIRYAFEGGLAKAAFDISERHSSGDLVKAFALLEFTGEAFI